jgi:hypothetical protein
LRDLVDDAGNQRRLTATALLVLRPEPVPALRGIRLCGLFGVHDDKTVRVRQTVHLRARGEVVGRLRAAVQHHDHRGRHIRRHGRHIDLVRPAARVVAEAVGLETAALLRQVTHRRAVACSGGGGAGGTLAGRDIDDRRAVEARGCLARLRRPGHAARGQSASDGLGHIVHQACGGVESCRRERPLNRRVDRVGIEGRCSGVERVSSW